MADTRIPPHEVPRIVDSPFQALVAILNTLFSCGSAPRVRTATGKACAELLGRHLLNLLQACGELNVTGYHSVAVTLLRPLEDALDVFAAVTMVAGAAERWQSGNLKPSEAAALWIGRSDVRPVTGESLADYRKRLRSTFNPFTHCAPAVSNWDVFAEKHPVCSDRFRFRVNHERLVIPSNAHRIDAFLVAHLWEVLAVVEQAFCEYFERDTALSTQLIGLKADMRKVLAEHQSRGLLDSAVAPELQALSAVATPPIVLSTLQGPWEGWWSCGSGPRSEGRLSLVQRDGWLTGSLSVRAPSGSAFLKIREDLHGVAEGSRLFLDGTKSEISPTADNAAYKLDSFDLALSEDGNQLRGSHSCAAGHGEAEFHRVSTLKPADFHDRE